MNDKHWLDDPRHLKWLWRSFLAVLLLTVLVEPFVALHPAFERLERRFGRQAKIAVLIAGGTGFYMTHVLDGWGRFLEPSFWWMHAMLFVWFAFTLVLFVLEPLVLHDWFHRHAAHDPEKTFGLIERLHRVLLSASLVTVAAAVLGAHGML